MHILLIPSWYSTAPNAVRGSFFRDQARALQKAGHQVGLLVTPTKVRSLHGVREIIQYWRVPNSHVEITSDESGLVTYRMFWWGWLATLLPSKRGDLALRVFDQYVQQQGIPDVVHGHSVLYGGYLAAYIGTQRHVPAVLTEHSTNFLDGQIQPGQGRYVRYTLEHSSRVFAVAEALAQALREYSTSIPIAVLHNLVDVDFFTAATIAEPSADFTFVSVGNLIPRKGFATLLAAFAAVFRGMPVRLIIGGGGKLRGKLEKRAADLGVAHQVDFRGALTRQQVRDVIRQSHVLVSASQFETFGITLIEALACGKPVVATRSGGPEYFVNDDIGILVEKDNPESLAAGMKLMFENYSTYDSQIIREYCVSHFSETAVVSRLEAAYRELAADTHQVER